MAEIYYMPGEYPVVGYLVRCRKCGRKLVVDTIVNGVDHNLSVTACCAECVELSGELRMKFPMVCNQIERWRDA